MTDKSLSPEGLPAKAPIPNSRAKNRKQRRKAARLKRSSDSDPGPNDSDPNPRSKARQEELAFLKRFPTKDSVARWLTRDQSAIYLTVYCGYPITKKTLNQYASRAHVEGPAYVLANGRAMSSPPDLDNWADSSRSAKARSSSEHADLELQRQQAEAQVSAKARNTSEHSDLARRAEIAGRRGHKVAAAPERVNSTT